MDFALILPPPSPLFCVVCWTNLPGGMDSSGFPPLDYPSSVRKGVPSQCLPWAPFPLETPVVSLLAVSLPPPPFTPGFRKESGAERQRREARSPLLLQTQGARVSGMAATASASTPEAPLLAASGPRPFLRTLQAGRVSSHRFSQEDAGRWCSRRKRTHSRAGPWEMKPRSYWRPAAQRVSSKRGNPRDLCWCAGQLLCIALGEDPGWIRSQESRHTRKFRGRGHRCACLVFMIGPPFLNGLCASRAGQEVTAGPCWLGCRIGATSCQPLGTLSQPERDVTSGIAYI